ncbi:dual specificity protein phosphatase 18-like isoform X3 [Cyprinodon tularosa]|nr:dual specificity protein phosphatase 18-like isoform X3 [Cyprinodon tularosa]XP_038137367.1 dual specificity protein phosphatase 18-like isoform X3 [Cyprinodon tularosa]
MLLSQVTPTLFLSGADAPLNVALMSQKGITLIVNATLSHAFPSYPGVECLRVPVCDLPCERLEAHFDHVADRINGNHTGGTLVHCAAGMSRSPALVMAYLMRYRGVTLCQAHRWVQESRPFIRLNVGFWEQLLRYERKLYGRNTVRVEPDRAGLKRMDPGMVVPLRTELTRAEGTQKDNRLKSVPRSPGTTHTPMMSRSRKTMSANPSKRGSNVLSESTRTTSRQL